MSIESEKAFREEEERWINLNEEEKAAELSANNLVVDKATNKIVKLANKFDKLTLKCKIVALRKAGYNEEADELRRETNIVDILKRDIEILSICLAADGALRNDARKSVAKYNTLNNSVADRKKINSFECKDNISRVIKQLSKLIDSLTVRIDKLHDIRVERRSSLFSHRQDLLIYVNNCQCILNKRADILD